MAVPVHLTTRYPTRYVCAATPGHLVVQTHPAFLSPGYEHALYGDVRRDERTGFDAAAHVEVLSGRRGVWRVAARGRAAVRFRLAVTFNVEDLPSRQAAIDAAPEAIDRLWAELHAVAALDEDDLNLLALLDPARVTTCVPEDRRVRAGAVEFRRDKEALHYWEVGTAQGGVLLHPDVRGAYALLRRLRGAALREACDAHLELFLGRTAQAFGHAVTRLPDGTWQLTPHPTGTPRTLPGRCTPEQALLHAWTQGGTP